MAMKPLIRRDKRRQKVYASLQTGVVYAPLALAGLLQSTIAKSPTIPDQLDIFLQLLAHEASSDLPSAHRRKDTRPVKLFPPSTTASQPQLWLPPPSAPRRPPQPVFTQDFDLFQPTTQARPVPPPRAPSLDSTLQPSFNRVSQRALYANRQLSSAHNTFDSSQLTNRTSRPPVPLFHSNSFGNTDSQQTSNLCNQTTAAQTPFDMGAAEINVAYEGTFGDLGSTGDAELFGMSDDGFDFELMGSHEGSFTAVNGGAVHGSTVSPTDLLNDISVPPSSSFTNLTTPGSTVIETPDDYQTSPLFTDSMATESNWFSLFPDNDTDNTAHAPDMFRTESASSISQIVVHPGGDSNRKRSSTTALSPALGSAVKHSSVAGVSARKRDKPLPPIVVDETDTVALKRARNTAAARKSRAKKVQERDDLEVQIAALQREVEYWKNKALGRDNADVSE